MNILADTTVWIHHFRNPDPHLHELLAKNRLHTHPQVIAELACGNLPKRKLTLQFLDALPSTTPVTTTEVRELIERHKTHGKGIGLIDTTLLTSTLITPRTLLWTNDKRLAHVADSLGILHTPE